MSSVASADINKLADALRDSADAAPETTQDVLVSAANYIKADMESRVPVRTGRLKQSIQIKVLNDKVVIGPNTEYAAYVEFGTKPHVIEAKPGNTLSWMGPGGRQFAKKVNHPGTKAQPYVRPAFEDWVDTLGALAAQANIERLKRKS